MVKHFVLSFIFIAFSFRSITCILNFDLFFYIYLRFWPVVLDLLYFLTCLRSSILNISILESDLFLFLFRIWICLFFISTFDFELFFSYLSEVLSTFQTIPSQFFKCSLTVSKEQRLHLFIRNTHFSLPRFSLKCIIYYIMYYYAHYNSTVDSLKPYEAQFYSIIIKTICSGHYHDYYRYHNKRY